MQRTGMGRQTRLPFMVVILALLALTLIGLGNGNALLVTQRVADLPIFQQGSSAEALPTAAQVATEKEQGYLALEQSFTLTSEFFNSDRTIRWSVSSGSQNVRFAKEFALSPRTEVKEGEIQAFSIWAGSSSSQVKEVTATIATTKGDVVVPLKLVEGDTALGRWTGFWVVRNITWQTDHPAGPYYLIAIQATNEKGQTETIHPSAWQNP